ncbi:hypothetical protein AGMMS49944_16340 [Spirochaetia bacterium]|nr:hypothetical protein AGMMS49944_16340 [Spirochaetia bacterium]
MYIAIMSESNAHVVKGKRFATIAQENGVTEGNVQLWAKKFGVPYIQLDGEIVVHFFDEDAEKRFKNRNTAHGRAPDEGVVKLADQFGVTKQCVRNWAEKQGIPKDENGFIIGKKEIKLFEHRNDAVKRGRPRKTPAEPKQTEGQLRNEERVLIEGKKPRGRPRKEK